MLIEPPFIVNVPLKLNTPPPPPYVSVETLSLITALSDIINCPSQLHTPAPDLSVALPEINPPVIVNVPLV